MSGDKSLRAQRKERTLLWQKTIGEKLSEGEEGAEIRELSMQWQQCFLCLWVQVYLQAEKLW